MTTEITADATAELKAIRKLLEAAHAPPALLGRDEMAALLGCGLSTFDRLKAAGKVGPTATDFGGPKWHRPEVEAWMANRAPNGDLHDAATWPAVWKHLRPRGGGR